MHVDLPARQLRHPAHLADFGVKANQIAQLVLLHHPQNVGLDFGALRVGPRPLRIGFKRERVQVRRHIARTARVHVVAPSATHLGAALQHGDRRDALLLQANGGAQATQPRANDGDFNFFGHRFVSRFFFAHGSTHSVAS